MWGPVKALVITGAMLTAALGAAAPASATVGPITMDTSHFACSGAVCEVGPGNVGMPFAMALDELGDGVSQSVEQYYGDDFTMKIISGSLPPGLKLALPDTEWTVTGTPTKAGTYPFTVQFSPTQDIAPNGGPSGTQQLTITIGTGSSDRLVLTRATWSPNTVNKTLQVAGFDVNAGATYTVYATSTGTQIGQLLVSTSWNDGSLISNFRVPAGPVVISETNPGTITVKDSLGGSATFPVTVNLKY